MSLSEVFIVTIGLYSDYEILAVFATRAEAEAYVGSSPKMHIDAWPLGVPAGRCYRALWYAHLDPDTGQYLGTKAEYSVSDPDFSSSRRSVFFGLVPGPGRPSVAGISAVSAEHALKIAVEFRQEQMRLRAEGYTP